MTKKRKITILGCSVLLVLLVGVGLAVGEAYERSPFKKGPSYFLEKMDAKAEELNLSEAQQEKFEGLKSEVRRSMEQGHAEGREIFGRIKTELGRENPDMNVVASLMKKQMANLQGRLGQGVDRFAEFYGVLDEKQKGMVLAKVREHMDKDHCRGHGGPWGEKKE